MMGEKKRYIFLEFATFLEMTNPRIGSKQSANHISSDI